MHRGVGMGIDEAGDQQPIGRIDPARILADALARRQHRHDGVVLDQNVGMLAAEPSGGENPAAVDQLLHVVHRLHGGVLDAEHGGHPAVDAQAEIEPPVHANGTIVPRAHRRLGVQQRDGRNRGAVRAQALLVHQRQQRMRAVRMGEIAVDHDLAAAELARRRAVAQLERSDVIEQIFEPQRQRRRRGASRRGLRPHGRRPQHRRGHRRASPRAPGCRSGARDSR